MTWRLVDSLGAYDDFVEQADYLESQADGLGDRFIAAVEQALSQIVDDPRGWMKAPYWDEHPTLYWRIVEPFHTHVIYCVEADEVRVIAYVHESRSPAYWRSRLEA